MEELLQYSHNTRQNVSSKDFASKLTFYAICKMYVQLDIMFPFRVLYFQVDIEA